MHIILQAHILSYSQDEEDIQNGDIWRKGQGSSSPKKYFLKIFRGFREEFQIPF